MKLVQGYPSFICMCNRFSEMSFETYVPSHSRCGTQTKWTRVLSISQNLKLFTIPGDVSMTEYFSSGTLQPPSPASYMFLYNEKRYNDLKV